VEPGEVAAHLIAARPTRPAAVADAVGWCERAAVAASSRLGHAEAATHLAAALTLPGTEAGEGRRLLGDLAEAQDRAGETAAARSSFRRLDADAAAAGDTAGLVRAALGVHRLGSRTAAEFAESLGLLAEAEAALPAAADRDRCALLAARAGDLVHAGWNSAPDATAVRRGRPGARAGPPGRRSPPCWRPRCSRRTTPAGGRAPRPTGCRSPTRWSTRRPATPSCWPRPVLLRATALLELGDPAARAELRAVRGGVARLGHARGRHAALTRGATAALLDGDLDAAARLAAEGSGPRAGDGCAGGDAGLPHAARRARHGRRAAAAGRGRRPSRRTTRRGRCARSWPPPRPPAPGGSPTPGPRWPAGGCRRCPSCTT
jgi:hypothetical protein